MTVGRQNIIDAILQYINFKKYYYFKLIILELFLYKCNLNQHLFLFC